MYGAFLVLIVILKLKKIGKYNYFNCKGGKSVRAKSHFYINGLELCEDWE